MNRLIFEVPSKPQGYKESREKRRSGGHRAMARDFFDIWERREKRRAYQAEYNKGEKGKARYRKWEKSPQGKCARRKAYEKRKKQLAEIKGKKGCLSCGESNPRVLQFFPRNPQKIKFLPILQNTSRSLKDWREVIRRCDVICLNCLAKKKAPGKSGRTRKVGESCWKGQETIKPSVRMVRLPENASLTKGREAISENRMLTTCECCEKKFEPKKKKQRFCSSRCRLLFWAAKKILELYCSGQANGLQEIVAELAEVKR